MKGLFDLKPLTACWQRVSAAVFLTCELTLDISKQRVMGKTGPPQIRRPVRDWLALTSMFSGSWFCLTLGPVAVSQRSLSHFVNCSRNLLRFTKRVCLSLGLFDLKAPFKFQSSLN